MRFGAGNPPDGGLCGHCGKVSLDSAGGHATCCAIGESTRGHNAVRDAVFAFAEMADPAAEKEAEDLVPSDPRARPADVLTSAAIPGCVAALDIGVVAPAAFPDSDATVRMYQRKMDERTLQLPELEAQGIRYRPMIWTCYGRPHADAISAMLRISKRAAR